jgi:hypothetical protein
MITSFFGLVGELIQKVSDHSFFSKLSSQVRLLAAKFSGRRKVLSRFNLYYLDYYLDWSDLTFAESSDAGSSLLFLV